MKRVIGIDADNGEDILVNGLVLRPCDRIVPAAADVAEEHPDTEFILVGDQDKILPVFNRIPKNLQIRSAPVYCPANQKISKPVKGSSLHSLVNLAIQGNISGFLSIGDTEKIAIESLRLHRYENVRMPTLAVQMPSTKGLYLLTDAGFTNQNASPELLHGVVLENLSLDIFGQAIMAASYAKNVLGIAQPRIGVLSNGTEDHKGSPLSRRVERRFKDAIEQEGFEEYIQYLGKVESRHLANIDILVTDGYTGNVYLKAVGDTAKIIEEEVRKEFEHLELAEKIRLAPGAGVLKKKKRNVFSKLSSSKHNGAPLLGFQSAIMKGHGNSTYDGIVSALEKTLVYSERNIGQQITEALGKYMP